MRQSISDVVVLKYYVMQLYVMHFLYHAFYVEKNAHIDIMRS
jgi:hypothetical protein